MKGIALQNNSGAIFVCEKCGHVVKMRQAADGTVDRTVLSPGNPRDHDCGFGFTVPGITLRSSLEVSDAPPEVELWEEWLSDVDLDTGWSEA
jgi:hypothetical protein